MRASAAGWTMMSYTNASWNRRSSPASFRTLTDYQRKANDFVCVRRRQFNYPILSIRVHTPRSRLNPRTHEPTSARFPHIPNGLAFRIQHASASARALFQRARPLRYIIKGWARVLLLRRGGCACTFESRYLFKDCARVRFFLCVCVFGCVEYSTLLFTSAPRFFLVSGVSVE